MLEGRPHIEDAIRNRQVQIVFNTTDGQKAVSDSKSLRRATLMQKVPPPCCLVNASPISASVLATSGTQRFLSENGVEAQKINKVLEGRPHIEDAIRNRQVQIVFNTTDGQKAVSDSKSLRRATLMQKVPYYTTLRTTPRCRAWPRSPKPSPRSRRAAWRSGRCRSISARRRRLISPLAGEKGFSRS